ncbi:hypothetical protein FKM82_004099 [Ascaphus truei]
MCLLTESYLREPAPLFQNTAVTGTRQKVPPPTDTNLDPDWRKEPLITGASLDFASKAGKRYSLPALRVSLPFSLRYFVQDW